MSQIQTRSRCSGNRGCLFHIAVLLTFALQNQVYNQQQGWRVGHILVGNHRRIQWWVTSVGGFGFGWRDGCLRGSRNPCGLYEHNVHTRHLALVRTEMTELLSGPCLVLCLTNKIFFNLLRTKVTRSCRLHFSLSLSFLTFFIWFQMCLFSLEWTLRWLRRCVSLVSPWSSCLRSN